jgi:hypothetical protein
VTPVFVFSNWSFTTSNYLVSKSGTNSHNERSEADKILLFVMLGAPCAFSGSQFLPIHCFVVFASQAHNASTWLLLFAERQATIMASAPKNFVDSSSNTTQGSNNEESAAEEAAVEAAVDSSSEHIESYTELVALKYCLRPTPSPSDTESNGASLVDNAVDQERIESRRSMATTPNVSAAVAPSFNGFAASNNQESTNIHPGNQMATAGDVAVANVAATAMLENNITISRLESYSEHVAAAGLTREQMVAMISSSHAHASLTNLYEAKWREDDRLANDEIARLKQGERNPRVPQDDDVCFGTRRGPQIRNSGTRIWRDSFKPYAHLPAKDFKNRIYPIVKVELGLDRNCLICRKEDGSSSASMNGQWYPATEMEKYDKSYQRFLSERKALEARVLNAPNVADFADGPRSAEVETVTRPSLQELLNVYHEAGSNVRSYMTQHGEDPALLLAVNNAILDEFSRNLELAKRVCFSPSGDLEGHEDLTHAATRRDEEEHEQQVMHYSEKHEDIAANVTMEDADEDYDEY